MSRARSEGGDFFTPRVSKKIRPVPLHNLNNTDGFFICVFLLFVFVPSMKNLLAQYSKITLRKESGFLVFRTSKKVKILYLTNTATCLKC